MTVTFHRLPAWPAWLLSFYLGYGWQLSWDGSGTRRSMGMGMKPKKWRLN